MIDIHTHILPGVDDGAQSMDEAISMIRFASDNGVNTIVLTPHYIKKSKYISNKDQNVIIYEKLKRRVKEEGIDVELILGNEVYATKNIVDLLDEEVVSTIGNTKYVLLETQLYKNSIDLEEIIYELTLCGYIPIIAHPERYGYYKDLVHEVKNWINYGALIQVNKGSFFGKYGKFAKKIVHKLIELNLVHFIASDCHRTDVRKPGLNDIYDYIKKQYNEDIAEKLLILNPSQLIVEEKNNDFNFEPKYIPKIPIRKRLKMS